MKRVAERAVVVAAAARRVVHGNLAGHFLRKYLNHYCYQDEAGQAELFLHWDRETGRLRRLRLHSDPVDS